jgi:hypothetical protein
MHQFYVDVVLSDKDKLKQSAVTQYLVPITVFVRTPTWSELWIMVDL